MGLAQHGRQVRGIRPHEVLHLDCRGFRSTDSFGAVDELQLRRGGDVPREDECQVVDFEVELFAELAPEGAFGLLSSLDEATGNAPRVAGSECVLDEQNVPIVVEDDGRGGHGEPRFHHKDRKPTCRGGHATPDTGEERLEHRWLSLHHVLERRVEMEKTGKNLTLPVLETARLWLRIPCDDDAGRMATYFRENRGHLKPWSPPQPESIYTEEFWRSRLPQFGEDYLAGTAVRFAMFPHADGGSSIIGTIQFTQIFRGPFLACYLGYGIASRWEGQGLMTEALRRAIGFIFEEMRLHRIMANYVPTNERSGRLLRRLGFVVEGYARDYLYIDDSWQDHVLTALTNPAIERP